MRIVAAPDGVVNRIDRALWMTMPFDRAWSEAAPDANVSIVGLSAGLLGTSGTAGLRSTDVSASLLAVSVTKRTRQ